MLVWDEPPVLDSSFRVRLWHLCPKAQREFVTLRAVSINESPKKKKKTFRLEYLFKEKQVGLDTAKVCFFFFG